MSRLILIFFFLFSFSYSNDIYKAFAVAIYDENNHGENIQHSKITQNDYNGKVSNNSKIDINIGTSLGNLENKIPLTNNKDIVIGYEYTFKHYTVDKGYIEVRVDNKLYDSKVYVK